MAKVTIAQMTGDGEQWTFEFQLPNTIVGEKDFGRKQLLIENFTRPYIRTLEMRRYELNNRILESMQYAKELPPDQQGAIHAVFDMMAGRAPQVKEGVQAPVPKSVVEADQKAIDLEIEKLKASGETIETGKVIPFKKPDPGQS